MMFKNQVASLTPQISYITTLDMYEERWNKKSLLPVSIGFFTLVKVIWGLSIVVIHRVISSAIPPEHREAVLHEYLEGCNYQKWELPKICCAEFGYLYVQLPEDEPAKTKNMDKKQAQHASCRRKTEQKLSMFKDMYAKLNPSFPLLTFSRASEMPLRAVRPSEADQAGRAQAIGFASSAPTCSTAVTLKRSNSQVAYRRMV
ncbi:unnamed protein product [Phytophthora lilii]|uniref:Unnamed protein product n=1 Tax=Phytophthora lilii TaxID=2077276 RepID=A0A9W6TXX8_9STRA|nr:unnamed protein product [Phytophthora lilii]